MRMSFAASIFAVSTLVVGLSFVLPASRASAAVPLGGLTVAVSPAGDKLVAGGDPRTLLVLDPATLAVKERIWIETAIVELYFDKSGATLAVVDTDGTVLLFDTNGWKRKATIPARGKVAFSDAAGLVAGPDNRNRGPVTVFSISDGKEIAKLEVPQSKTSVLSVGFSPDGKKIAVVMRSVAGEEKKLPNNEIPKELKGLERSEFMLRNDGKVSEILVFDAASGKQLARQTSFLSEDSNQNISFDGETLVFTNYRNVNARIAPDGNVTFFETPNGSNYGIGVSPDQKLIMTGGLRSYTFMKPDGAVVSKGELAKLPGWPEYFKGFSATADGKTIYGATTGYRIIKFGADGKSIAAEPVR